jgi:hypothetical protein
MVNMIAERLSSLPERFAFLGGAAICRWVLEGTLVDIMPTQSDILGFAQSWYEPAIEAAIPLQLNDRTAALFISAPYFLATKLEAFRNRGNADYFASHDLEDITAVDQCISVSRMGWCFRNSQL